MPSLRQLNEAVLAYMSEHPDDLITVVVDATFGHRITASEVAEFDAAVANNELVSPPAGAIGRGDAFVLSIAHKVGATILSNDSYQEFHGAEYDWLFEEGRLIGGKPVPHIGWVFVARTPVRGPVSRKAVKAKRARGGKAEARGNRPSPLASQPMPVPKSPPPGRSSKAESSASTAAPTQEVEGVEPVKAGRGRDGGRSRRGDGDVEGSGRPAAAKTDSGRRRADGVGDGAKADAGSRALGGDAAKADAGGRVPGGQAPVPGRGAFINEPLPFLSFVERHPIGSLVQATVDAYSSHGAYVSVDGARGYVPLRLMADPAPRAARDVVKLGETRSFVVASFNPARRGIDLSTPEMASAMTVPAAEPVTGDRAPAKRGRRRGAAAEPATITPTPSTALTDKPAAGRRVKAADKRAAAAAGSDERVAGVPVAVADRDRTEPVAVAGTGKAGRRPAKVARPAKATSGAPAKTPAGAKPTKAAPVKAPKVPSVKDAASAPAAATAPPSATKARAPKATRPSTSKPPTTLAPTTLAPTTRAPGRKPPMTGSAVTQAEATNAPPAKAVATKAPSVKAGVRKAPEGAAPPSKAPASTVAASTVAASKVASSKVASSKVAASKALASKAAASKAAAPSKTAVSKASATKATATNAGGAKKAGVKATAKRPAR